MNLDIQTLVIIGVVALLLLVALFVLLRGRRVKPIARERSDAATPYVARQDRPYVKPKEEALPPEPVPQPEPIPEAAPSAAAADNLQTMKGVGPKLADRLAALGYTRFDQLAALDPAAVEALDAQLGPFAGRLARDRIIEQATYLARGDHAGFEERFGSLGGGAAA